MNPVRMAASVAAVVALTLSAVAPMVAATQPSATAIPPFTDVQEYRNTNYRTGVFPGPGPVAQPVKVWSRTVDGSIDFTPELADGMLLVGTTEGHFFAMDARTGAERWRFTTGGSTVRFGSVADGTVVFSTDGTLHALELATGTERWNRPGVGTVSVIDGGIVYFPGSDGHVYGAELATGQQVWDWTSPGTVTDISVADGTAYASVDNGRLYAISVADGTEQWHLQSSGSSVGIPTIGTDQIFATSDSGDTSEFYTLDRASGKTQWTFQTPNPVLLRPGALADGVYYLGTIGDGLYAFPTAADASEAAPNPIWHTQVDGGSYRNQAVVGNTVYVTLWDKDEVVALDKATGAVRWTLPLPGHPSGALVSGGMLFVADQSGAVSAYAEPDLAVAIGPTTSGPLPDVVAPAEPPNPFTVLRTLDPSTTTLKTLLAFDVGPDGLIYALDGKPSVTVIDPATGKVVRTWGSQGSGQGEFDVRDLVNGNPGSGDIDVGVDGTVYVADGSNHRVQVFTADGKFIRQMGSFGSQPGQFAAARTVAADAEGSVYVGDDPTGTLTKFGPDGSFVWRNPGGPKWTGPTAQLPDGRIASLGDSGVYTLDAATGKVLDRWGTPGNAIGEFGACDFAVDQAGDEYINSCAPNRTQVFDPEHNLVGGVYGPNEAVLYPVFGPQREVYGLTADRFVNDDIYVLRDSLIPPPDPFTVLKTLDPSTTTLKTMLAMDVGPDGLIYALDMKPSVTVIDPATGAVVRTWGRLGTGDGEFDLRVTDGNPGIGDIAVGSDGKVYVADGANHRVQVFQPDGTFIRQLGSFGTGDGQFTRPGSVTVDGQGGVYAADGDNGGYLSKFDESGAFVWRVPGKADSQRLAHLPDGRIVWILGNGQVATVDPATGSMLDQWGVPGFADGEIGNTCEITGDGAGNEYILSCAPDRTQVFDNDHQLVGGAYTPQDKAFVPVFAPNGAVYASDWGGSDDSIYILKDSLLTP